MTRIDGFKSAAVGLLSACLLTLTVSGVPVYAHGDEQHGETASAAAPAEGSPGLDQAMNGHDETMVGHDEAMDGNEKASESSSGFVGLLKKLHPATVHFPIALFLMAALTELFIMSRRTSGLEPAVRVMIYGGAAGAVVAALFGWIHTGLWFGGDTSMQIHRWSGTLLAILGLVLAAAAHARSESRSALRALLFLIATTVLVQGFLGGELAHGPNHLGM